MTFSSVRPRPGSVAKAGPLNYFERSMFTSKVLQFNLAHQCNLQSYFHEPPEFPRIKVK